MAEIALQDEAEGLAPDVAKVERAPTGSPKVAEVALSAAASWLALLLKFKPSKGERPCALETWKRANFPH
eukprot:4350011-Alexandrium_andersonii.AAC.1